MNSRRTLTVAVLLTGLMACGDDSAPPIPPMDGAVRDMGVEDVASDGPIRRDAGGDSMPVDTGHPLDVGFDAAVTVMDAAPMGDPCEGYIDPGCGGGCPSGSTCLDDVCGGTACVPGRFCLTTDDCGGAECVGAADPVRGTCATAGGGCDSSLDCALGFACEASACVNRRVPCFVVAERCPRGYVCAMEPGAASFFCTPAMSRCTSDSQCELGFTCVDVDGDGMNECLGGELCSSNDDCRDDGRCGVDPSTSSSECMLDGACGGGAGCAEGRTCTDLTGGNAAPTCELSGSCSLNTDCPAGQVCAAPGLGLAPTCIGGA